MKKPFIDKKYKTLVHIVFILSFIFTAGSVQTGDINSLFFTIKFAILLLATYSELRLVWDYEKSEENGK